MQNSRRLIKFTYTSGNRAAFERVSIPTVNPAGRESTIDYRTAQLPPKTLMFHDKEDSDNYYDPLEHREHTAPISVWMAYLNLIKIGFGPGVLAFPVAISQTGFVFGPFLGLCTGVLLIHTHLVLLNCLNEICRKFRIPHISYRYGFRVALLHGPDILHEVANNGPTIIAAFMMMSQVGICCVFIDLTSDSLRDLLDWQSSRPAILCLLLPYLLLAHFMKTLKIVTYISMLGNILNLVGFCMIIYHAFLEPHGAVETVTVETVPLSFAIGIFLFNSSAVGVILSLDRALLRPKFLMKKCGIFTIGMGVSCAVGIAFGMLVYWSFGAMEENCLRSLPYDDESTMVIFMLYLISVAFSYPIQCYPGIQIFLEVVRYRKPTYEPSDQTIKVIEKISRPCFVFLTFFISYMVPLQTPFVAFVGNLCTTMLSLIFPALMELCLMYPGPYGLWHFYLIKDVIIILVGVTSWLAGVALCSYLIYIKILSLPTINDFEYF